MAASIGSLVVSLEANTAKFTQDLERARGTTRQAANGISSSLGEVGSSLGRVERGMGAAGAAGVHLGRGLREVGSVTHEVGSRLAGTLSPALGEAVNSLRSLGREIATLPTGLGLLVAGLAVGGFALTKFIERIQASIKLAAEIQTATRGGDRGALEGLLQQRIKETDEAVEVLKRSGNAFTNILGGDVTGALEKVYANFAKDFTRSSERIQAEAAQIGAALVALIPLSAQAAAADYGVTMARLASTAAAFGTGLAQSGQDLDAFTDGIYRQRQASSDLATALEKAARAKLALAEREIAGKTFLSPAAQGALLGEARAGFGRDVGVIAEEAGQRDAALLEQLRTGTEQINTQRHAGIIANIDAEITEYENELRVLERLADQTRAYYEGLEAQSAAGLIAGIEAEISAYEDELRALERVSDEQRRVRESNEQVAVSLQRQIDMLRMSERAAVIYAEGLKLSTDATDQQRAAVEALAGQLFDLQKQQEFQKGLTDSLTNSVVSLGDEFVDMAAKGKISWGELAESAVKDINKIILRLLILKAIEAATSYFGNLGSGPEQLSGPGSGYTPPRAAKGGVVKARPGGRLIIAGEAGSDEAIIPLDRMAQLGGGGSTSVEVNVYAPPGSKVEQRDRRGVDGRQVKDIIIGTVNEGLSNGTFDKPLTQFGITRSGHQR